MSNLPGCVHRSGASDVGTPKLGSSPAVVSVERLIPTL